MPLAHWGTRDLHQSLDETAYDPKHPQAFPAGRATDLIGRLRVRLRAEDHAIVGYGFGGQRIEIPSREIGAVRTTAAYRTGLTNRGPALLVFDRQDRILLRARGLWETYGEVERVCRAAGAPAPSHATYYRYPRSASGSVTASQRRQGRSPGSKQRPAVYRKAPGYRRLRTRPRGSALRVVAAAVVFCAVVVPSGSAGVVPAILLPGWIGSVRVLIGIAGVMLGVAGGIWLFTALAHVTVDALRWAHASREVRALAPAGRFFRRRERSGYWPGAATAAMVLLVPALIGWGPGVTIATAVHAVADSHLVADLRANGVSTRGLLIDVPDYQTSDNGDTTVKDVATLTFTAQGEKWQDTDPSIGGRPLPLDSGDPAGTNEPVTVIYDPGAPDTAAARQQLTGSVWHGAPTGNVVVGIIFTLALPVLIWRVIVRISRQRQRRNLEMVDGLAARD